MKQILNICSIVYLIWTITILTLSLMGKVVFGQGAGDLFYLILLVLLQIISGYIFFRNLKGSIGFPLLISFLLIVSMVLFSLKMTIWRGLEYPWNGSVFFE